MDRSVILDGKLESLFSILQNVYDLYHNVQTAEVQKCLLVKRKLLINFILN